ncbi:MULTISPECIES: flavin reductase family protein [Burkholderia]|nr:MULTISPECIES: flavin reductase family protein [Burkholderia]MCG0580124.1 flavin reductase family protein [Burkholderia cenocepacia]MCL4634036.1 flavin reductase family protein [Burkholderia sp.]MCO1393893.1 flavin reductase family protein [Burkholderia cenocepacia]MCO1405291.1 flavin reductase family protein [Burkholderia cenocepacia]MCW5116022.1 flavin reductase family protein [Burkholderia cenocepacia]
MQPMEDEMSENHAGTGADADEQRRFRAALSMFATGVAVITAPRKEGMPIGITVASFNSVSLDPPLILFSVDRRSLSLGELAGADGYAVNVLDETQQHLSNCFAKANGDKWGWRGGAAGDGGGGVLLPDALATFECEPYAQYDGGDHVIFVGRVMRHRARPDGRPLIFFGGRYRALDGAYAPAM